jgi:hypothetical protein
LQKAGLKYDQMEKEILEEGYSGNPEIECLGNFSERMKNLAPFVCLVRRLGNLQKYPDYDIFSIGMGVMLYVLENMLIGRDECTIDEISGFLQSLIYRIYKHNIPQEDSRELAFYIRDAITGSGETYQFEYMNLEKGSVETVPVKMMDVSFYEIKKTSRYKLSDQGMELLFKTREIYSEFRLNVTQLYLRQQIEKGVFVGALQTVNELSLQVRQLRERIERIITGIRQNVMGVDFKDLKNLLERIQEQFNVERKEFSNIRHILGEQKRNIDGNDYERLTQKDLRALRYIKLIADKIGFVSQEHDRLFNEKLDIIGEYLKMLEFRMRSGITDYMDFESTILDWIGAQNIPCENIEKIFLPLFVNKNRNKAFNIMKAIEPQRIRSEEPEERESINYDEFIEKKEREQKEEAEKRNLKIEGYLEKILLKVLENKETSLKAIVEDFDEESYEMASKDFDFYSLIVMLHQRKEVDLKYMAGIGQGMVYDSAYNIDLEFLLSRILERNKNLKDLDKVGIISTSKMVTFKNGNIITDYEIVRMK